MAVLAGTDGPGEGLARSRHVVACARFHPSLELAMECLVELVESGEPMRSRIAALLGLRALLARIVETAGAQDDALPYGGPLLGHCFGTSTSSPTPAR